MQVIKTIIPTDLQLITYYINQTILTNMYPDELKIARIKPMYKNGDKDNPDNYRPIAILPSLAKIF